MLERLVPLLAPSMKPECPLRCRPSGPPLLRGLLCSFTAVLATTTVAGAGERRVLSGYAVRGSDTTISFSASYSISPRLTLPAAPADRSFLLPTRVRWEVELSSDRSAAGLVQAVALRGGPQEFAWPAGEELSPARFSGASNAVIPVYQPMNPLGVAAGSGIPDYDSDGVPDEEDAFPGDPSESLDTDGDGIGNAADPDDDNDGIPDSYEIANGLDPLVKDANRDPDGDGANNLAEYEAGTRANDASSRFHVASVTYLSPGTLRLTWDAVPGRSYTILRTSLTGRPVTVANGIRGTDAGPISRDVTITGPADFFILRVVLTPTP